MEIDLIGLALGPSGPHARNSPGALASALIPIVHSDIPLDKYYLTCSTSSLTRAALVDAQSTNVLLLVG